MRAPACPSSLMQRSLLCLLVLIASTPRSAKASRRVDLSYLHRAKPSTLATAVRSALGEASDTSSDADADVEIDLTNSLLGKEIEDVVGAFKDHVRGDSNIRLTMKRNGITFLQAKYLIKTLFKREQPLANATVNEHASDSSRSSSSDVAAGTTTSTEDASPSDSINVTASMSANEAATMANTTNTTAFATANATTTPATATTTATPPQIVELDLSWNDLHSESRSKGISRMFEQLIRNPSVCPKSIRLDLCGLGPAACRGLAKGIMRRFEDAGVQPISLSLRKNEDIGDAGVAAIAAAIRSVRSSQNGTGIIIFDRLDLSACAIGDDGAKALAIALEESGCCIRHLDLSGNDLGNIGVTSLCNALCSHPNMTRLQSLDLSNNEEITDAAAGSIGRVIELGIVPHIAVRSCNLHADAAAVLAKSMRGYGQSTGVVTASSSLKVDLSGNPFGVLRKKKKGAKYSATALKSKASETTKAYMNLLSRTVKKGLQDFGVAASGESDDEAEEDDEDEEDDGQDPSKAKCGALSFAGAFLDGDDDHDADHHLDGDDGVASDSGHAANDTGSSSGSKIKEVQLGLRRCFFDTKAADALAATCVQEHTGLHLKIDATMNTVLEDETVAALANDDSQYHGRLEEMADRYLQAMEIVREARRRSQEAMERARAQQRWSEDYDEDHGWDDPETMHGYDDEYANYDAEEHDDGYGSF